MDEPMPSWSDFLKQVSEEELKAKDTSDSNRNVSKSFKMNPPKLNKINDKDAKEKRSIMLMKKKKREEEMRQRRKDMLSFINSKREELKRKKKMESLNNNPFLEINKENNINESIPILYEEKKIEKINQTCEELNNELNMIKEEKKLDSSNDKEENKSKIQKEDEDSKEKIENNGGMKQDEEISELQDEIFDNSNKTDSEKEKMESKDDTKSLDISVKEENIKQEEQEIKIKTPFVYANENSFEESIDMNDSFSIKLKNSEILDPNFIPFQFDSFKKDNESFVEEMVIDDQNMDEPIEKSDDNECINESIQIEEDKSDDNECINESIQIEEDKIDENNSREEIEISNNQKDEENGSSNDLIQKLNEDNQIYDEKDKDTSFFEIKDHKSKSKDDIDDLSSSDNPTASSTKDLFEKDVNINYNIILTPVRRAKLRRTREDALKNIKEKVRKFENGDLPSTKQEEEKVQQEQEQRESFITNSSTSSSSFDKFKWTEIVTKPTKNPFQKMYHNYSFMNPIKKISNTEDEEEEEIKKEKDKMIDNIKSLVNDFESSVRRIIKANMDKEIERASRESELLKKNEELEKENESLNQLVKSLKQQIEEYSNKCSIMKAKEKLQETKILNLKEQLELKIEENTKLAQLCDELINNLEAAQQKF